MQSDFRWALILPTIRAKYSEIRFAKKSVVSVPDSAKIKIKGEWQPAQCFCTWKSTMHKGKGMQLTLLFISLNGTQYRVMKIKWLKGARGI